MHERDLQPIPCHCNFVFRVHGSGVFDNNVCSRSECTDD